MIVSIEEDSNVSVEFRNLYSLVWSFCNTDVTGTVEPYEVVEKVRKSVEKEFLKNDGQFTAARVLVKGACKAHNFLLSDPEKWKNEIRLAVADSCNNSVWLEKVLIKTTIEADIEQIKKRNDPVGDLLRYIDSLGSQGNQEIHDMLSNVVSDLNEKLPYELKSDDNFRNSEKISEIIGEVRQILLSRLLSSAVEQ